MILWDFLDTCQCDQELYIYLTNDYGEYLPVYHGTKQEIDFWEDEVFDILQSKIEVFEVLPDGSIQIEVRDADFDKPMKEQFASCKDRLDYWKSIQIKRHGALGLIQKLIARQPTRKAVGSVMLEIVKKKSRND